MQEVQIIKASKDKVIRSGAVVKNKIRVAPYARVSTDSDEQKNSYESQKKYYQELVSNKPEWELVDIYADEAISGTQVYKRTDFMRMINGAMEGKIDMIITKSISRFARNTLDTLSYVRQLKDKGVAVFFEKENINTLTMNGELLLVILSSLAQQESESIGGNIKLGLKMKMSRGKMVGFNRCLGYSYDKNTKEISIVPEEAEIVRYIFKRYIDGIGTYALAKELTRKGFKNAKGEVKWQDGSVACILKNEKYKGDLLQGKSFTVDSISHKRLSNKGESDKFYLENHHEPIVSRKIWDKAESIRKSRNRIIGIEDNRRTKSRQHSFSCMIECAYCSSHFIRRTWHSSSKNEKHVWSCIKRTNTGRKYCPKSESIDEKTLEKCFVEVYNTLLDNNKEIIDNLTNTIQKIVLEEFDNNLIDSKTKEIKIIEKKISSLLDLGLESKIENTILESKMSELTKEKSNFLYDVMEQYGGCEKFYKDFFMSFVCPLGLVNVNSKGNEVNANYYESKKLENVLYDFIVDSLKKQIAMGIDTSICYCIESGENFKFLTKINEQNKFFDKIVALEHPRFIMQYNSKDRDKYLKKYINSFNNRN